MAIKVIIIIIIMILNENCTLQKKVLTTPRGHAVSSFSFTWFSYSLHYNIIALFFLVTKLI